MEVRLGMTMREIEQVPGHAKQNQTTPVESLAGGLLWTFSDKTIYFSTLRGGPPFYRATEIIHHRKRRDDGRRNHKTN